MSLHRSFVDPTTADGAARPRRGPGLWRPFNPRIASWRGLRVWVVGASSGIGLAAAEQLIGLGATVLVSARSEAGLQALVDRHTRPRQPAPVQAWPMDVTDRKSVV